MSQLEITKSKEENIFAARYGGEEFCALVRNAQTNNANLLRRMEVVRVAVEAYTIPPMMEGKFKDQDYKKRTITIAGGIRASNETPLSLVMRVDDALTNAKDSNSRNTSVLA